jgi:hypothetical protein
MRMRGIRPRGAPFRKGIALRRAEPRRRSPRPADALPLQVSNASGYLCRIQVECSFDVPPEVGARVARFRALTPPKAPRSPVGPV